MSTAEPPPGPVDGGLLVAPPPPPPVRRIAPPPPSRLASHPADALFREHGVLERRLPKLSTVYLTAEQRAFVPSDLPDILDLTNLTHVLSLVGAAARFSRDDIRAVQLLVRDVTAAVAAFKLHGDAMRALKDRVKAGGSSSGSGGPPGVEVTLEDAQLAIQRLRDDEADVGRAVAALHAKLDELKENHRLHPPTRSSSTGAASADNSNNEDDQLEPRVFPIESAEWIIRPIFYFKDEYEEDPAKHTFSTFAKWAHQALSDPALVHMVEPLLRFLGALRPDGTCDVGLTRSLVADYMKYFKASLPETVWLVDDKRRAPPAKPPGPPSPLPSPSSSPPSSPRAGGAASGEPSPPPSPTHSLSYVIPYTMRVRKAAPRHKIDLRLEGTRFLQDQPPQQPVDIAIAISPPPSK